MSGAVQPAPPAATARRILPLTIAALALALTNAVTLALLWRSRRDCNNNSARRPPAGDAPSATDAGADADADGGDAGGGGDSDDERNGGSESDAGDAGAVRLAAGASQPTAEAFHRDHRAHAGTPAECPVRRTVYCRDTNDYLSGIAVAPLDDAPLTMADAGAAAAAAAASSNVVAGSSSAAVAAAAAPSSFVPAATGTAAAAAGALSEHAPLIDWSGCSVVTSVPDVSETGLPLGAWRRWFRSVCTAIMVRVPSDGVAIFYQTDVKVDGLWVSKAELVMEAARRAGLSLCWHKIVVVHSLRTVRGSTAGYSHLLCFSRRHRTDPSRATPDLLASRGPLLWPRAMGLRACEAAVRYLRMQCPRTHTLVDPFCGSGSVLATANAHGLHSVGVDHSRKRAVRAADLPVERVFAELRAAQAQTEAADKAVAAALGDADGMEPAPGADAAPVRSVEEQARRAVRQRRKEQRKATNMTQREQQQMEKEERRRAREEATAAAAAVGAAADQESAASVSTQNQDQAQQA